MMDLVVVLLLQNATVQMRVPQIMFTYVFLFYLNVSYEADPIIKARLTVLY